MLKKCLLIARLLENRECVYSKELNQLIDIGVVTLKKKKVLLQDEQYVRRYFEEHCKEIAYKYNFLYSKGITPSNMKTLENAYKLYKYLQGNMLINFDIRHISVDVFGDSKTIEKSETLKKILDTHLSKNDIKVQNSFNIVHLRTDKNIFIDDIDITKITNINGFFSCFSSMLEKIKTSSDCIVTFENLSPFFRLSPENSLFIYVGGFQNIFEVAINVKQFTDKTITHFGDIDPSGLIIADILIRENKNATFYPDIDTIKLLKDSFGLFTTAERDYDENSITSPLLKDIAIFMKKFGRIRIEQEAITSLILQGKIKKPEWVNKK